MKEEHKELRQRYYKDKGIDPPKNIMAMFPSHQEDKDYIEWLENHSIQRIDADLLAVEIVDALSETGRLSNNDLMKIEAETTIKQTIINHKKK